MEVPRPRNASARPSPEITGGLRALKGGGTDAGERLAKLVYGPLRAIAHRQLQSERSSHTLQTTGLVHEAYLKLVGQQRVEWNDRAQFFAVAARVMRRILVDYARQHHALRRGAAYQLVSLDESNVATLAANGRADELIALDEALGRLEQLEPRLSQVVECRFFAGFTEAETAEVLGVTPRTVARDWVKARGWLYQELRPDDA
jgi:RNA polymerase sigma factor (TIGR02999 family)